MKTIIIDPLSTTSVYIHQLTNGQIIGSATGFVIEKNNQKYLITNWHVVSGRHPESNQITNPDGLTPTHLQITYHAAIGLGNWIRKIEPLLNADSSKKWLEHSLGQQIDVVALPLENLGADIIVYSFDLNLANTDIVSQPAMPVSIIGYPLGLVTGVHFPIWKTGHIASDPDLDFNNKPVFLIDATTRGGMSGSPVVMRMNGGYQRRSGAQVLAGGIKTLFLGVYSGRIQADSEIGMVWRPVVIDEIFENACII